MWLMVLMNAECRLSPCETRRLLAVTRPDTLMRVRAVSYQCRRGLLCPFCWCKGTTFCAPRQIHPLQFAPFSAPIHAPLQFPLFNSSIFQFFNLSISQLFNFSIFSIFQSFNLSIFQSFNLFNFSISLTRDFVTCDFVTLSTSRPAALPPIGIGIDDALKLLRYKLLLYII